MPNEKNDTHNFDHEFDPPYSIESRIVEFEADARSIRAFLAELGNAYEASKRVESYNRKNIQTVLGVMEAVLRNELRYLEDPKNYRQWEKEANHDAYMPEL